MIFLNKRVVQVIKLFKLLRVQRSRFSKQNQHWVQQTLNRNLIQPGMNLAENQNESLNPRQGNFNKSFRIQKPTKRVHNFIHIFLWKLVQAHPSSPHQLHQRSLIFILIVNLAEHQVIRLIHFIQIQQFLNLCPQGLMSFWCDEMILRFIEGLGMIILRSLRWVYLCWGKLSELFLDLLFSFERKKSEFYVLDFTGSLGLERSEKLKNSGLLFWDSIKLSEYELEVVGRWGLRGLVDLLVLWLSE